MSIAGLTLAAVILIIGVYMTPLWINRRHAMVLSREDDRFSTGVHMISGNGFVGAAKPDFRSLQIESRSNMPLLAMKKEEEKPMGNSQTPRRPQGATQSAQRRLSATQTRELALLKAKRASRLSAEASAAKRRLVTTLVALAAFVVVIGLAAASVLSWWWLFLPGFFLGGSLISSRMAGINSERKNNEELNHFRELRSTTPQEKLPEAREAQKVRDMLAESVESSGQSITTKETIAEEEPAPVAESATTTDTPHVETVESEKWDVQPLPVPSHKRKSIIKGREVHADTDIAGVPRVKQAPGRPVEATPLDEEMETTEGVSNQGDGKGSFSFDLDAILDARRA